MVGRAWAAPHVAAAQGAEDALQPGAALEDTTISGGTALIDSAAFAAAA
ncbi:hypothetical protein [Paracoccus mutanolyticus]|nr:hypothetical protein [Paracoccus mutanolyticus]